MPSNGDAIRQQSEVLATLALVADRIAHDVNNSLGGMQSAFLLIKDAVPPSHPHYSYVGAIVREIDRIASMMRELRDTFPRDSDEPRNISVSRVLTDTAHVVSRQHRSGDLRIEVDTGELSHSAALPNDIVGQIVYQLLQNAAKASRGAGIVTVRAWSDPLALWISVRDRGPGIPLPLRDHFMIDASTHGAHTIPMSGGVGSALIRQCVSALNGHVEIRDPEGGGTEVVVRLPWPPPAP